MQWFGSYRAVMVEELALSVRNVLAKKMYSAPTYPYRTVRHQEMKPLLKGNQKNKKGTG